MRLKGLSLERDEFVSLEIEKGLISSISVCDPEDADEDQRSLYVAPGFLDLQINGFGGQDFVDPELTVEKIADVCLSQDVYGVTGFCPTLTTESFELLSQNLSTVAKACKGNRDVEQRVLGIHLEGPYISAEDGPRGAHPLQHCRPCDWDEFQRFQEAADGRIRILTLSPEYEGSPQFIERVVNTGVRVAIGHTAADSEQISVAVDHGACFSTHLGNGAHGTIRRHPNYIWDQRADDRLSASLIVDGHHLPRNVVKSFVRCKTPQRCLLVSDITGMAGMAPGVYQSSSLGSVEVMENGRLVVAGQRQYLAGAALPISIGIGTVMDFAEVSLATAVEMATKRPAELLGIDKHGLKVGNPANLVLFSLDQEEQTPRLRIANTILNGEVVYS